MSVFHLNLAFRSDVSRSSSKFVLVALADYANEDGEAYPSVETLCNKTALNRKTVLAALRLLFEGGFICDTGRRRGSTGQVKVYKLSLGNGTNNGTVKESQKRNSTKNGTVPKTDMKKPKNGTLKESQKRDIEPSVLLTTSEPPVLSSSVQDLFNSVAVNFPNVLKLNKSRIAAIKKLSISDLPTLDAWEAYFVKANSSAFLAGASGWVANFDWLLKPANVVKVAEGNYDNRVSCVDDGSWMDGLDDVSDMPEREAV